MTDRPDCIHHVAECPDCGGLIAERLDRIDGITDVTITYAGGFTTSGDTAVYIGPAIPPCTPKETDR